VRMNITLRICLMQLTAALLGLAWGLMVSADQSVLRWLQFRYGGIVSVLVLGLGIIRCMVGRSVVDKRVLWMCVAVVMYEVVLMVEEPFAHLSDDGSTTAIGLLLLAPLLLVMGFFARVGEWSGGIGAALFFATSTAMLILNGNAVDAGSGFFRSWAR